MVVVRFFAGAREAAGTSKVEIDADTVGEALEAVIAAHGEALSKTIDVSKIWLNGEPTTPSAAVSAKDEIAVLPPVSGGV